MDAELAAIRAKIEPLVTVVDANGVTRGTVEASMYYDQAYLKPATAGAGGAGVGQMLDSPIANTAVLGGLGLLALGLMFYMVKKTTQDEALPTVEELSGVPQSLPADEELVGEADEIENTLAGVELDEASLRARKVSEQISEMIQASPQEAGSLLGKWVVTDD